MRASVKSGFIITHKILLLLLLAANVKSYNDNETDCDGVVFHQVYYDKDLIVDKLGRPYNLVMHKYSGVLFFSHTIQTENRVDFGIMACEVEKKECEEVKGVVGGYAVAYDPGNDDIFFGGHNGIYKYNFLTKSAEFFSEEGKSIWEIFVRKNFYYIEYPTQKLFVYQDDRFVHVAEAMNIEIDHFYVSKHQEIYFSNRTAVYKVERNEREPTMLDDEIAVRQINEDKYGDIYFCASTGIFLEDKPFHRLKNVARIEQAFGLTFDDSDHVIYSDQDAIYKLVPSDNSKVCLEALSTPDDEDNNARKNSLISK